MGIRLITATIAMLSVTAALSAQTPRVVTPQPPDHPRPSATQLPTRGHHAKGAIKITGCLGEPVAPRDAYVLTDVKMSTASHVSAIGVSTTYEVHGLTDADLKKHVNHRVELTGQIEPPESGSAEHALSAFQATDVKALVSGECRGAVGR